MGLREKFGILGVVVLVSALLFSMISAESDADGESGDVVIEKYSYTHNIGFSYNNKTPNIELVEYVIHGYDDAGKEVPIRTVGDPPSKSNEWYIQCNSEDVGKCTEVWIKQIVWKSINGEKISNSKTMKVIILDDLKEGEVYKVTFHDGYSDYSKVIEVNGLTQADKGEPLIFVPDFPTRVGYSCLGWFIDPDKNIRFDPTVPIKSDLDVYAKWSYTGGPGPGPEPPKPETMVTSLHVSGDFKTEYVVGQYLNINGLQVNAEFLDGHVEDVTSKCSFSPSFFDRIGKISVVIEYNGSETSIDVVVAESSGSEDQNSDGHGSNGAESVLLYVLLVLVLVLVVFIVYKELKQRRS